MSVAALLVSVACTPLLTRHRYCQPFIPAVTFVIVSTAAATPESVPSLARSLHVAPPSVDRCHWQFAGDQPLKPTANRAFPPAAAVSLDGCPVSNGTTWRTPLRIVELKVSAT